MRNHGEKHKDMIESVLPSRARKAARQDRRLLHHQARARQRTALAVVAAGQDDEGVDFREGRRKSALKSFVRDRRDADNVGALTRWAAATVRADPALRSAPVREQVAYFAAILPAGLIGRHAVSHIEAALEFGGRSSFWPGYRARLDAWRAEREAGLRAALRQILAEGVTASSTARCAARTPPRSRPGRAGKRPPCRCACCSAPTTLTRSAPMPPRTAGPARRCAS